MDPVQERQHISPYGGPSKHAICFACGKKGHKKIECPDRSPASSPRSASPVSQAGAWESKNSLPHLKIACENAPNSPTSNPANQLMPLIVSLTQSNAALVQVVAAQSTTMNKMMERISNLESRIAGQAHREAAPDSKPISTEDDREAVDEVEQDEEEEQEEEEEQTATAQEQTEAAKAAEKIPRRLFRDDELLLREDDAADGAIIAEIMKLASAKFQQKFRDAVLRGLIAGPRPAEKPETKAAEQPSKNAPAEKSEEKSKSESKAATTAPTLANLAAAQPKPVELPSEIASLQECDMDVMKEWNTPAHKAVAKYQICREDLWEFSGCTNRNCRFYHAVAAPSVENAQRNEIAKHLKALNVQWHQKLLAKGNVKRN